jgi:hypothetical protein
MEQGASGRVPHEGEKDSALDAYAMSLLFARDEKLKTTSFRGKNSIIIALIAEELGEHHTEH